MIRSIANLVYIEVPTYICYSTDKNRYIIIACGHIQSSQWIVKNALS